MAWLIIKSGAGQPGQFIGLKPGVNRIGRNPDNDFMIADAAVAPVHCEIRVEKDRIWVRDFETRTGTQVNGKSVEEAPVPHGAELRIGNLVCVLEAPAEPADEAETTPATEPAAEPPVMKVGEPRALPPNLRPYRTEGSERRLADGLRACIHHANRHAAWECGICGRAFCEECVRRVQGYGGHWSTLCVSCTQPCTLTEWGVRMRAPKPGALGRLVGRIKAGLAREEGSESPAAKPPAAGPAPS